MDGLLDEMDDNGDNLFDEEEFVKYMLEYLSDATPDSPGVKGAFYSKAVRGAGVIAEQRKVIGDLFDKFCSSKKLLGATGMLRLLQQCRKNSPPPLPEIDAGKAGILVLNLCPESTRSKHPRLERNHFVGRMLFTLNLSKAKRLALAQQSDKLAVSMGLCNLLENEIQLLVKKERDRMVEEEAQRQREEEAKLEKEKEEELRRKRAEINISSDDDGEDDDDDDDDDDGESGGSLLSLMPKRAPIQSSKAKATTRRAPMKSTKSMRMK